MKVRLYALIIFLLFGTIGCYATITGTLVDAETGEPIEGAVVLVEWTKTHGFGLTYTESYKEIEAVTDKEGKTTIAGVFNPTVNPPHVTVYKKGYVAWNNNYIFPTWEKRKDFEYKSGITIQLQHFKESYSHYDHASFISSGAVSQVIPQNIPMLHGEQVIQVLLLMGLKLQLALSRWAGTMPGNITIWH